MIYRKVLCKLIKSIGLIYHFVKAYPPRATKGVNKAILFVCKRFHVETSPLIYTDTTFYITNPHLHYLLDRDFLGRIGPINSANVTRLWMGWDDDADVSSKMSVKYIQEWCHLVPALQELRLFRPNWSYEVVKIIDQLQESDARQRFLYTYPEQPDPDRLSQARCFLKRVKRSLEAETKRPWKILRCFDNLYVRFLVQGKKIEGSPVEVEITLPITVDEE